MRDDDRGFPPHEAAKPSQSLPLRALGPCAGKKQVIAAPPCISRLACNGFRVTRQFSKRSASRKISGVVPEPPLFGQDANSEACKYDKKHNGGGGGKFVITLFYKDNKHKDHTQDRQQNE
jgi:hypothetical protein